MKVICAEEGVGNVAIFNYGGGDKATLDDSDPTFIYDGDPGVADPQQTEDGVYQAFVRQWFFAQVPGPTVGASVSVGGGGAGGRNGQSSTWCWGWG